MKPAILIHTEQSPRGPLGLLSLTWQVPATENKFCLPVRPLLEALESVLHEGTNNLTISDFARLLADLSDDIRSEGHRIDQHRAYAVHVRLRFRLQPHHERFRASNGSVAGDSVVIPNADEVTFRLALVGNFAGNGYGDMAVIEHCLAAVKEKLEASYPE